VGQLSIRGHAVRRLTEDAEPKQPPDSDGAAMQPTHSKENHMAHPVVHAEIRSQDPDATRQFFADLFGWKVASEGAFPGYTFIDTGADGGTYVAISPRQSAEDEVLFFVAVDDVAATLARAEQLGGTIIQPVQQVPGTSFGVFADAQGHKVGVASNG
jgi:predicted enzyme related to lactoylglutathione lyase